MILNFVTVSIGVLDSDVKSCRGYSIKKTYISIIHHDLYLGKNTPHQLNRLY